MLPSQLRPRRIGNWTKVGSATLFDDFSYGSKENSINVILSRSKMRFLILTILLAAAANSQTHSDFTGTWKQDNSRSTIRPGSTIQYSNKVEHQESKLSVTTIFGANGDHKESSYTREYTIGGEPTVTADRRATSSQIRSNGKGLLWCLKPWKRRKLPR